MGWPNLRFLFCFCFSLCSTVLLLRCHVASNENLPLHNETCMPLELDMYMVLGTPKKLGNSCAIFLAFFSQKVRCRCVLQNDATHQVPGNCLPGAGANLYVGLTDSWETLQATWSLNHVHLELFVEVSQHIQVEQVGPLVQGFFKSDGPTFGVAVKTLLGHLMGCTWTGDCQVHLYKDILMIFPLQNIKIIQIYCFWLRFFMIFPYISTTKHQIEWLT